MPGLTALIDGYSLMYRAYHALQTPMSAPDGTPTNAIHGFMMMLARILDEEKPDRIIAAFDPHAPSFRRDRFEGYKATRKPMPDDLRAQDPVIRGLIALLGIPIVEVEGYEADDVIGTLSALIEREGGQSLIVTGDRDSFQLVSDSTTILYTKRGVTDTVLVTPEYIRETYGIAPEQLIDVKSLMGDASDNIPGIAGIGEKTALKLVQEFGDTEGVLASAPLQKGKLKERLETGAESARMSRDLARIRRDIPLEIPESRVNAADVMPEFKKLGLMQVTRRFAKFAGEAPAAPAQQSERAEYATLPDLAALSDLAKKLADSPVTICHGTVFSLSAGGKHYVLPLGGGDLLSPGATAEDAYEALRTVLTGSGDKVLYDVKELPFPAEDVRGNVYDAKLMSYVLKPQRSSFALEALCGEEGIFWQEDCPSASLSALAEAEKQRLEQDGTVSVYRDIELPLAYVLRRMQQEGCLVDAEVLAHLQRDFSARIDALQAEVYSLAGGEFNINSPKQLAALLYDTLGLPAPRGKSRSTDAEMLEYLSQFHPVCEKILEYRKYKKLLSTYVDALLRLRHADGRVRTSFDQVATATGRISSLEPNLQNIPVRTPLGREIRRAFVAKPGHVLVDADYSQIELRVLAHISGDETMRSAFVNGEDIHARTAAEVYELSPDQVTPEMRSRAKAVNFGIVYGISDFALAKNTGTTRQEARAFMDRYFERYPGVKQYMADSISSARDKGYAETLMGRRRYIPELASDNYNVHSFGERCAMNSPIQGTAADIIKIAMVRVEKAFRDAGLSSRLILQVHDELIAECLESEADQTEKLLQESMEGVMTLSVPLIAEASQGRNWCECK